MAAKVTFQNELPLKSKVPQNYLYVYTCLSIRYIISFINNFHLNKKPKMATIAFYTAFTINTMIKIHNGIPPPPQIYFNS